MQQFSFVTPSIRTQQSPAEGNPPAALLHRKSLVDGAFQTCVYTVAH
ncbi:hypothetical protein [Nostoc sp.]